MGLRQWVFVCGPQAAALLALCVVAHAQPPVSLDQALQAQATGHYAQAEQAFHALRKGKQASLAQIALGRLQLETGRYAEAELSAAAALAKQATDWRALTLRGEALQLSGKLDAAEQAFALAVREPAALRARVQYGRLLQERGRTEAARAQLMAVIEAYNDDALGDDRAAGLCYVGMAARALGSMHDANDAFREAALADRSRVETQLEWAALFIEKNDFKHADESVQEALKHNPNSAEAHALLARLLLLRAFDFPAAAEHLDKAAATNPRLGSIFVTRAGIALREMDVVAADRMLNDALAINPGDLEALSVRAAVRFLADDAPGFAQAKSAVLQRNASFSRMFSIIGEYAEWEHRYTELVEMAREALALNPDDALAYAMLGLNLLRLGEEPTGLAALHEAWKRDHFNVQVFNTLNLYEKVIDLDYVSFHAAPFEIRTHRDERAVLEPYLVPMLHKAYEDMRKRYRFTPEGQLRIELYADVENFSVRTTGLPNVGVQGVCFGKVVTALSPRGGPFNWGQITWHELAHIFHLQLSRNHVPRWFTEGLAEYETIIARPEWRREEDAELWSALKHGQIPTLRDLNKGFTQAHTPQALMTAYYAASQAVVYIVERFGFEKITPMLQAWGRGERTEDVFAHVLGVSIDQLNADFRASEARRLSKYDGGFDVEVSLYDDLDGLSAAAARTPDDPDAQAALAFGLLARGRLAESAAAAARAIARVPQHALANFAMTRILLQHRDVDGATRSLRAILAGGTDGYIVRVMLARAELAAHRTTSARVEAEHAIALDADQLEAWRVLLQVADLQHDQALGRRAIAALASLDQHDRDSHLALLSVLRDAGDFKELERAGERALFVDPANPRVHGMLGQAYLRNAKPGQALVELDRALALGASKPGHIHLARGRALRALGRGKDAVRAAAQAVLADPTLKSAADRLSAP